MELTFEPNPLLEPLWGAFELPEALSDLALPPSVEAGLEKPLPSSDEELRACVRALLRQGGYKPSGRGKPSSEYLSRTAAEGGLPRINAVVDLVNLVSLESGLPLSVVDLDLAKAPLRVRLAPEESTYVFNASGQEIQVDGLPCLFDAEGPCANAVKDAQRTKTSPGSRRVLILLWCPISAGDRGRAALERIAQVLRSISAKLIAASAAI